VVRAAGKEIVFGGTAFPAVNQLLSGQPAAVSALAVATGVDVEALTDVLIAKDICVGATATLLAGYRDLLTR
jgi:hypothetical protein